MSRRVGEVTRKRRVTGRERSTNARGALPALLLALTVAVAHAGPRTSATYSIVTDTTDSGGDRTASGLYTNDGSAGSVAGLSTVAAPFEFAKSGYIGQLYDIAGLQVTAPVSTVDSGLGFQLGAVQVMDDGSYLIANPDTVSWNVLTGPVSGVSGAGVATAGTVSQNTSATIEGSLGGINGALNLTVIPLAISTQNSQQTVTIGQSFTFMISPVSAEGPFTYQWLLSGSAIPGASGASYTIGSAAMNNAGNYTVLVTNSLGSFIAGPVNLIVQTEYDAWAGSFFGQQSSNPAVSGPAATPQNDGIPNALKYLFDINPAIPMSSAGYAALPVGGFTAISGTQYLTLTYRENQNIPGITLSVQTSSDAQTWQAVTPDSVQTIGTDPVTGDPIIEIEVKNSGAKKMFLRLQITLS